MAAEEDFESSMAALAGGRKDLLNSFADKKKSSRKSLLSK